MEKLYDQKLEGLLSEERSLKSYKIPKSLCKQLDYAMIDFEMNRQDMVTVALLEFIKKHKDHLAVINKSISKYLK